MRNFIRAPPNAQNIARPPRIGLGNVLFANHREKIIEWHSREVTVEPPAVADAPWIIDRIIHDGNRKCTEFRDQTGAQIGALIDPNQVRL